MNIDLSNPVTLHGSSISYFTGKMENYFRVKGIPYQLRSIQMPADKKRIESNVGLYQIPAVELPGGRWMTDTTAMIQWFEGQYPDNPILPVDPVQAFVCRLLEDYADEWLWRPAMHYRWHYPAGAELLSRNIADEHMAGLPLPGSLKRWVMRRRQRQGYTRGDGITVSAVDGVEAIYSRTLAQLQDIFAKRPFILGDKPSLADIGLSGPFFRHFGLDPVPQEIMRQQAPAVYEWIARLWNTAPEDCQGDWLTTVPEDLGPLLNEVGASYLPYLCANVEAVEQGKARFDTDIAGVSYKGARYSQYRVWCLQELRRHFQELPEADQATSQALLEKHQCWEPLWRHQTLPLQPGQEKDLPFKGSTKMVGVNP
jgi:glutathione S-transferase